jgi:hypothetical protein
MGEVSGARRKSEVTAGEGATHGQGNGRSFRENCAACPRLLDHKIAATTLGETAGDAVTMSMNLGYLVGTVIFAATFVIAVGAQIAAKRSPRSCSGR